MLKMLWLQRVTCYMKSVFLDLVNKIPDANSLLVMMIPVPD